MDVSGQVTVDQMLIMAILAVTITLFLWGRWRHDLVAGASLLACVLAGLVPPGEAFSGFGHPAVITVACVLILSRALQNAGAVDMLTRKLLSGSPGPVLAMTTLTALAAVLSAFMNNVGALALLMPVALQVAARQDIPPGRILMPLAFGSILGGMTTLIGTPPNLIVAGFRLDATGNGFGMFDFAPVGLAVAAAGIAFLLLVGWRLVPQRERAGAEGFDAGKYLTEARIPTQGSKAEGMTLREIESALDEAGAQVVGLIRDEVRIRVPHAGRKVLAGDILVIEGDPDALASALSTLGLKLEEERRGEQEKEREKEKQKAKKAEKESASTSESPAADKREARRDEEIELIELTVAPDSRITGRSASDIHLRGRYGVNLLAVSRRGRRSTARLRTMNLAAGDVLLVQGPEDSVREFAYDFGCIPLASRPLRLPNRRRTLQAGGVMALAVAAAAFGLLPAAIAFAGGVMAVMALRLLPLRNIYEAVDWPVIVLLGALIPVAAAMAETGAASQVAQWLLIWVARGDPVLALATILIVTMALTNFMNNAATAAAMCPIAIGTASMLGVNIDAFLMAVAVGASCAFVTPIGHQNNTLILGPGGFRFGDYWKLGLPMEAIVVVVGIPMILLVWPL